MSTNVVIRSFMVAHGSVVHLVHEGNTRKTFTHDVVSMCGKSFPRTTFASRPSTCRECMKRDNPLDLTPAQIVKLLRADTVGVTPESCVDLIRRDLVDSVTTKLTTRGRILIEDIEHPVPWPDEDGLLHARTQAARSRGRCGADLLGTRDATFARLNKMLTLGDANKVSCINCLVDG